MVFFYYKFPNIPHYGTHRRGRSNWYTFGMKKQNKIALTIFIVFYILFGVAISIFQERIIYRPTTQSFDTCEEFQSASKINYHGTRMYVKDINKPVVVLYHGNAGSACDRYFYADMFNQAGYGYVVVEYAGFSGDSNKPSHNLVKQNVQDVIDYLNENKISNVTVVGESIGTGVASYHASLQSPSKLLLISPFSNLSDVAKNHFWFYPTFFMVDNAFDNGILLNEYRNQVTIIHGDKDDVIPYKLSKKLYDELNTKKELVTIKNAGHNDLFSYPETYTAILSFLKNSS